MLTNKQVETYKERCKRRNKVNQLDFFERYLEIIRRKGRKINMQEQVKREKRTKFSIIIPMKDAEKYITSALDSIEQQQFSDIQILVIDDNSETPLSKYRVSKWKEEHPEINLELLETEEGHTGPGGARNVGLDNATGEYILFLDADDKLNENALNSINQAVDNNPQTDIFVLGYQLTRIDCNGNEKKPLNLPAGKLQESRAFQIGANTAGSIWNNCIRRSLFGEKDNKHKIRFKENCKFEDLPTKVNLFVRNKKKIKAVPTITHTQYSRPNTSITGTLSLRDVPRLTQAHREIANLKKSENNIGLKDKIYIDFRKISFLGTYSWLIQKSLRNKLDRRKQQKREKKQSAGIGR